MAENVGRNGGGLNGGGKIHKIIIAGFGGQGVMLMGQVLAYAAMIEGREVTYMPAYGPEMRGGTANCSIIISHRRISSPIVTKATAAVVMNQPSLAKFEKAVADGGCLFINASMVGGACRGDVAVCEIRANDIAGGLSNDKAANMVMLGAVVQKTGAVRMESVYEVMKKIFTGPKEKFAALNAAALDAGRDAAAAVGA